MIRIIGLYFLSLALLPTIQAQNTSKQITFEEVGLIIQKIADSLTYYYINEAEGLEIGTKIKNN